MYMIASFMEVASIEFTPSSLKSLHSALSPHLPFIDTSSVTDKTAPRGSHKKFPVFSLHTDPTPMALKGLKNYRKTVLPGHDEPDEECHSTPALVNGPQKVYKN